ncbi:uncharacterized protein I303_105830 [Kwoniella dejecticola CBS 10117]|uniref:FAS1 domain-containing protein n=1 Tax=Kwoniella dejecticola CBS 10117 TaxID=1296121 RepID=A0A1A6A0H2_9TREE|nr:uncharacterized protein I303_05852 [Kwoniella dejecticola CBS 10117]OBR83572.1 hypothetical protein I303_05852 [Kwoniella dejecticola CBS 10117]
MRSKHSLHLILVLFAALLSPISSQLDDDIICPDGSLTDYLTSLLDVLSANGLTTFEQLIVHWSETDMGYEFLHDIYNSGQKLTILVPTNQAFEEVGIVSPFNGLTEDWGTELGELHVLQGEWTAASIPQTGHGVAATSLLLANELNQTDSKSNAYQAAVLQRGKDNTVIVNGWWGNATSWKGPVDLSSANGLLDNLVILPIDQVLSFPPSLSTALQAPGLTNMSSALGVIGKSSEVEQLTEGGFTIFVPLDTVWDEEVKNIMVDEKKAPALVQNHSTKSYSLFSPAWTQSGSMDLNVESGEKLTIQVNQDGSSSVIYGKIEAKLVRSDVTLNNGVLHIIDKILYPTSDSTNSSKAAATSKASTAQATGTASASIPDGDDSSGGRVSDSGKDGEKAVIPDGPNPNSAGRSGIAIGAIRLAVFSSALGLGLVY